MYFKNIVVIETPKDLLKAAEEYFNWAVDHPILTEEATVYRGDVVRYDKPKVRVLSIGGLATRMGYTERSLRKLCASSPEFADALERIEDAIRVQRLEHGHAGTINAQMAMRELGMVEKTEVLRTDIKMEFTGEELSRELKKRGLTADFVGDVLEDVTYEEIDAGGSRITGG